MFVNNSHTQPRPSLYSSTTRDWSPQCLCGKEVFFINCFFFFELVGQNLQRSTCVGPTLKNPNYVQILPPVVLAASEVSCQTKNPTSELGSGFHLIKKIFIRMFVISTTSIIKVGFWIQVEAYPYSSWATFNVNHDLIWPAI